MGQTISNPGTPAGWPLPNLVWACKVSGVQKKEDGGLMQAIVTKQEAITDDFRRIQFIHQGQTIVTVSQTIRHKLDAKPRVADLNWGALSSASFEQVEAIGYALLEAVAIAREWSKIVEETDVTNHSPKLFMVRHDERRLRG